MGYLFSRRVIGLDIGIDTIKAVQVTIGFRGPTVTGFAKKKRDGIESPRQMTTLSDDIRGMLDGESMEGDVFISAVSCNSAAVRNMTLPFANINKVRQVIKYEVESVLPFVLEDILVDFFIVDRKSGDSTDLLVMALPKEVAKGHLEIMKGAHIDPEIVDLDTSALFYCFTAMEGGQRDGSVAIIDLGAKTTAVSIVRDGTLRFVRSIPRGGEDVTKAISEALSVDMKTAEALKRNEGTVRLEAEGGTVNGDAAELKVSRAITGAFNRLMRDIDLSFSFYQTRFPDEKVAEILLTGGASNIGNIDKYFERELAIRTSLFSPLQHLPNALDDLGAGDESIMTGALGLALSHAKRTGSRVNFRKEQYSFKKKYADIRKDIIFIIVGVFMVFSLFMGNLFTNLYLKEKQYTRVKAEIRQVFTQTFPEVRNIVNEVQQMKNRLRERKIRSDSLKGMHGGNSFLDVLREVSLRIPKGREIRITKMLLSDDGISIVGEADSFDAVDKMNSSLKQSKSLKKVEIKDAKTSTREGIVSFDLRLEAVDAW